jgi:5-(carboxyamino)imidazole ribonucleotide synthase
VLEQALVLETEVSVVVARTASGHVTAFPVAENAHVDGILDLTVVPAAVSRRVGDRAVGLAMAIADALDYVGVLAVEMFVVDGDLVINELAPRPHNSGHYTIDACVTSQFEQQARILADLPLGETRQHTPAVMVNLLGDIWFDGPTAEAPREPAWREVLAEPRAKLHLYGKAKARRGRKMGHVTCLGATLDDALGAARAVKRTLSIPGADAL